MSDFLIQFDATLGSDFVSDALRARERMEDLRVESFRFAWGRIAVQRGRCFGYDPLSANGRVYFAVGRPRVVDFTHEDDGAAGFTRRWASWVDSGAVEQHYEELTGLFLLGCCGPDGLLLVTDRLGYYSTLLGRDRNGRVRAVGTLPDLVVEAAGRASDVDVVSVGEMLVRFTPKYPYTLWRGITELAPGSLHEFAAHDDAVHYKQRTIWAPAEPDRYPPVKQLRLQLTDALRHAVADVTRGAGRVAVTLSGGVDSRTVLALLPPDKRAAAITFVDHENFEWRVARRVAKLAGVPHIAARRYPEFYSHLPAREIALLGNMRTAMHAHGFVVVDAGLADRFDLVLSGLCSDTLLKAYFWPENIRAILAARMGVPDGLRSRMCRPRYDCADPAHPGGLWALRSEIQLAMQERLSARLAELRKIRPESALEWTNFYPTGGDVANYPLSNMRLFPADELFLHRDVIEVARIAPPVPKLMQRLTGPVFARLCGPLARIENTKTGLPSDLGWLGTRLHTRLRRWRERLHPRSDVSAAPGAARPWYTEDSWPNLRLLQQRSTVWAELRRRAAASDAGMDLLASVLHIDPRGLLSGFNEALGSEFQVAAVQLALWLAEPRSTAELRTTHRRVGALRRVLASG
jgi:hypothetical protein